MGEFSPGQGRGGRGGEAGRFRKGLVNEGRGGGVCYNRQCLWSTRVVPESRRLFKLQEKFGLSFFNILSVLIDKKINRNIFYVHSFSVWYASPAHVKN